MNPQSRRFRLGLFTAAVGGLFIALLAFILQGSLSESRASYYILFRENVKGMVVGSKVNFQGVPIGVVSDMRFQQGLTLVELRVDPARASIQDITRARMDRLLVTGQVTVELEGYGREGRPLPPGAMIEPKEDPLHALTASLPEVVNAAAGVLLRLDRVLARAESALDENNCAHLTAILQHTERAAAELAEQTLPAVSTLIGDMRGVCSNAGDSAQEVTATAQALAASVASLQSVGREATALLRESRGVVASMRGPAVHTLAGTRAALDDLRAVLRQLKLAPDSLLFGVRHASPAGGDR